MNKPTISLKKKPPEKDKPNPEIKKEPRPATQPKKDRAPKSWQECLTKWRGGMKDPAPLQCVVYQLVAWAHCKKRPELLDLVPEEWQELARERYKHPQPPRSKRLNSLKSDK